MSNCATEAHPTPTIEERLDTLEQRISELRSLVDGLLVVARQITEQREAGQ